MNDQETTLAEKAREYIVIMQFFIERMNEADTDEKKVEWLARAMQLFAKFSYLVSEALTDAELDAIKREAGDKWDMWKQANTAEGVMALIKHYAEEEEEETN